MAVLKGVESYLQLLANVKDFLHTVHKKVTSCYECVNASSSQLYM